MVIFVSSVPFVEHIVFIFDRYVEGVGVTEIADRLNKAGVRSQSGKAWTTTAVRSILKNEVYVGDVIFRKTPSRNVITGEIDEDWKPKYVRDHHVGIVSRETWEAAKAIRDASRRVKTATV
ncbi:MAG: recombinase family protein [Bacteroidaceae bacterium]|nr:recombinase family protein [Bacteroidaceae bacterium]